MSLKENNTATENAADKGTAKDNYIKNNTDQGNSAKGDIIKDNATQNSTSEGLPKRKLKGWVKAAMVFIIAALIIIIFKNINFTTSLSAVKEEPVSEYFLDICVDSLKVDHHVVKNNQTMSDILMPYDISSSKILELSLINKEVLDVRQIRAGNKYTTISTNDSIPKLKYFIYAKNMIEHIVCNVSDTMSVSLFEKDVVVKRKTFSSDIESSLYLSIQEGGGSDELSSLLADIYQWSIDFYGIQKGDNITVIYDEMYVDTVKVGVKQIHAAKFTHMKVPYYAIGFVDGESKGFWDESGASLRKAFLKAPLKFNRISSKFSYARRHPVLRIVRPHLGVDYAAPTGTPVWAVADGVITLKSYNRGGGNTVKIRHDIHNGRYVTGYLHLSRYGKGISVGKRVRQGDIIGYVGSTGLSTGPHLDYRIWKNGKAMNPLKLNQEKGLPISKSVKESYKIHQDSVRILLDNSSISIIPPTAIDSTLISKTEAK